MKVIIYIATILSTLITMSSFDSNRNYHPNTPRGKTIDSTSNFVRFSLDGANTTDNKIKRLNFYYLDSLAHGQGVGISATGTNLIINAPTLLLESSAKQTPFLIYPGEKINIKYAGSDSVQMYIQGNAQRTNELNFFRKLVQKTGNVYYFLPTMPYQRKVSSLSNIHELEKTINNLKITRLQFLNSFAKEFPVSADFSKIAFKSIESTAIVDSLLLYYNNRVLLNKQKIYPKFATAKISTLTNIGFVPHPMYYVACIDLVSIATGTSPYASISDNSSNFIKRFDFVEKNFTGVTKDFLMANTLYSAHLNNVSISQNLLNKFNTQCQNKGYKEIINKRLNENKANYPKGGNMLLSADGKTVQELNTVISKYKGKIALLDFWASWCSPCREELPYTKNLKNKFAGKNVVFITISTDANKGDWQKANKEEALGNDNSFLLLNADQSTFIKHYHINSIPRYLLLGKDSKVISDDAPRPSDPRLKKLIDKSLSSNLLY